VVGRRDSWKNRGRNAKKIRRIGRTKEGRGGNQVSFIKFKETEENKAILKWEIKGGRGQKLMGKHIPTMLGRGTPRCIKEKREESPDRGEGTFLREKFSHER